MTVLTSKGMKILWQGKEQRIFETLKELFVTAPILLHFDWTHPIVIETETSYLVSVGVQLQQDSVGSLHPIAFYFRKYSTADTNYEIYDKELMAIL